MQNTTATGTPTEATALQESAVLARRFVALAFCRADLLFELDDDFIIRFSAGATPPLFGKNTNELIGVSFLDLVYDKDREMVSQLLSTTGIDGRFDDVAVRLVTQKDPAADAAFAGYRISTTISSWPSRSRPGVAPNRTAARPIATPRPGSSTRMPSSRSPPNG